MEDPDRPGDHACPHTLVTSIPDGIHKHKHTHNVNRWIEAKARGSDPRQRRGLGQGDRHDEEADDQGLRVDVDPAHQEAESLQHDRSFDPDDIRHGPLGRHARRPDEAASAPTVVPSTASSPGAGAVPVSSAPRATVVTSATASRSAQLTTMWLTPPSGLEVASSDDTRATFTWDGSSDAARYEVRYSRSRSMEDATSKRVTKPTASLKLPVNQRHYVQVAALAEDGTPLSTFSKPVRATLAPLIIGSYNIRCASCDRRGKHRWTNRRANVVKTVVEESPDVLGLQEATSYRGQVHQLIAGLGGAYTLVPAAGASDGSRIVYDAATVRLVTHGALRLPGKGYRRFASWAILEQKETKRRFYVLSTHLEPGKKYRGRRIAQTRAIVSLIRATAGDLPVFAMGDFNSYKFDGSGNKPYAIMTGSGYLDPLGNTYRSRGSAPGAFVKKRINTQYDTSNRFESRAPRKPYINGTHLDYIFTSAGFTVSEFEVVVHVDASGRWTMWPIPSDHNMIRATVFLP